MLITCSRPAGCRRHVDYTVPWPANSGLLRNPKASGTAFVRFVQPSSGPVS